MDTFEHEKKIDIKKTEKEIEKVEEELVDTRKKIKESIMNFNLMSGWKQVKLEEVCNKITDGTHDTPKIIEKGIPFITAIHIKEGHIDFDRCYFLPEEVHSVIFSRCNPEKGDVLFVNIGAGTATPAYVEVNFEFSMKNIALLKPNRKKIYGKYLEQFLIMQSRSMLNVLSSGGAQPFLSLKEISKLKITYPESLKEQQSIIEILSLFDYAIEKTEQFIRLKEKYKKGMMQKSLKGEGKYKKLKNKKDVVKLKDLVKEVSERNKKQNVNLVLSVTNSHGFRPQTEQFDRVVASSDLSKYKIVRKGQFGYSPPRINVGSIARLEKFSTGLISPIYVVFETKEEKLLPEYMKYFIQTWAFKGQVDYLTQGSVRESLGFDSLQQIEIYLPSLAKQQKIVNLLSFVDDELDLLKAKRDLLKTQKKGLMQQLLTGKIRVKVKREKKI